MNLDSPSVIFKEDFISRLQDISERKISFGAKLKFKKKLKYFKNGWVLYK